MKKKGIKTMKKRFFTLIIAIAMVVSATLTLYIPAGAVISHPENQFPTYSEGTVYYFADSNPIIDSTIIENYFGNVSQIVYDIKYYISMYDLQQLHQNNYFDGLTDGCIVIFELKTWIHSATLLDQIIGSMIEAGCTVVFVNPYATSTYGQSDFMIEVFDYVNCKKDRLYAYVTEAVTDMINDYYFTSNGCILIDSRLINANQSTESLLPAACATSSFLRILLETLCIQLNLTYTPNLYYSANPDEQSNSMLDAITNENIRLLVTDIQLPDDILPFYWDIKSKAPVDITSTDELTQLCGGNFEHMVAMGIWALVPATYDLWESIQYENNRFDENTYNYMPIFVLAEDPITDGDGLEVISDRILRQEYDDEEDNPFYPVIPPDLQSDPDEQALLDILFRIFN